MTWRKRSVSLLVTIMSITLLSLWYTSTAILQGEAPNYGLKPSPPRVSDASDILTSWSDTMEPPIDKQELPEKLRKLRPSKPVAVIPTYGAGVGVTEHSSKNYTRTLVIAKTKDDDTDWVQKELRVIELAAYVANDLSMPLHTRKNKGHEVMVYLTYIIEHWHKLPDIVVFLHSHRYSWHNNELWMGTPRK